jgi:endonuclease/exonuclease/phosphatase family metal-dependent hydrolase
MKVRGTYGTGAMRLLSYNIHKGVGTDRRYNLDRIIGVIEEEAPDVVCLQEVDTFVHRSDFDDQPSMLADHFKARDYQFQLNVPKHGGGYGNLVLSKWPFLSQHQMSLRLHRRKPRGALLQVIDTPEGPLHLVNWHLGLRERERRWQVQHLLNHHLFHEAGHFPTVIVGDFNDWRNTLDGLIFARHQFAQATSPYREFRSFPSYWHLMALDKLFFRGELTVQRARIVRTELARRASDHFPLVADLRLHPSRKLPHSAPRTAHV